MPPDGRLGHTHPQQLLGRAQDYTTCGYTPIVLWWDLDNTPKYLAKLLLLSTQENSFDLGNGAAEGVKSVTCK